MKNNNATTAAAAARRLTARLAYAGLAPRRDFTLRRRGAELTLRFVNPGTALRLDVVESILRTDDEAAHVGAIYGAKAPLVEIGPKARKAAYADLPAPHPFLYGA